ncbi:13342_t:CDS:1, partial [Racocetra persica]
VCTIPATNAGDSFLVNCTLDAISNTPTLPISIRVYGTVGAQTSIMGCAQIIAF